MSETSVCRTSLSRFCVGNGVDIGYGGDSITSSAITIDMAKPYNWVGKDPQNLVGDCRDLYWFKDSVLDYVYSSHLLEDFLELEIREILKEWFRVLRPYGLLILYCPVEKVYREHCKKTGQIYNLAHKLEEFSLDFVKKVLDDTGLKYEIVHEVPLTGTYSFELVVRKL